MMKNLSLAMMLPALVLAGCGGDGGGSGGVDCDAYCAKGVECEPSTDLAECQTYCANYNKLINSAFGSAVMTCVGGSCQQMESCVQTAMQSCNGSIDSFLTRLCNKEIACQGTGTVEQCKAALLGQSSMAFMKCMSSWALSTLAGCAEAASCTNFEAEMNACAESKLGIDMGGSDN
ncbi:MAG: hypothetical protein GYA21_20305 [Myxococcales bacterium]|nr:hypothetical protein [Myxococcales bacterium]